MEHYQKAKIILKNIDLIEKNNSKALVEKTKSICGLLSQPDMYSGSVKQKHFVDIAYNHILPLIQKREKEEKQLKEMSELDRLWYTHSSNQWDEESGPYKAMNYDNYRKVFSIFQTKIKKLEDEINELKGLK